MKLKRIDHIGVIVADLAEAGALLEKSFELVPTPGAVRADLRTAFFKCGDASIELIEVLDPEARRQRLGEGQRARIEHIAFEVEDLGETLHALELLGIQPTAAPRISAGSLTFWSNPKTSLGVMYQFLQKMESAQKPQP